MAFRASARFGGATLAVLGVVAALGAARPASAQEIERKLAGIRLGMKSTTVLALYGNPNDVVIGDIGIRQAPGVAGQGQGAGGAAGAPASPGPGSSSLPGFPGGSSSPSFGGPPSVGSGGGGGFSPKMASGSMSSMGGAPAGRPSGMGGGPPMGAAMGPRGEGGPSGFGLGGERGDQGGGGGAVGGFGQTVSPLANEQEVTWVYNRKVGNNVVSYEFLIGPGGAVSQIRVSGYKGGNSVTNRHIELGSQYKEVVKAYGYPEEHEQVGNVLVASYKQHAHVSFQFLNESGQTDAYHSGYKVIAITIAQVD